MEPPSGCLDVLQTIVRENSRRMFESKHASIVIIREVRALNRRLSLFRDQFRAFHPKWKGHGLRPRRWRLVRQSPIIQKGFRVRHDRVAG